MKALKSINFFSLTLGVVCLSVIVTPTIAQEYDDMYFNKSDRKTVKVEKVASTTTLDKNNNASNYKKISESTETYSAKNVNPEYIARYKSTESNEVNEQLKNENKSYASDDYFVEDYDRSTYIGDTNKNNIDPLFFNKKKFILVNSGTFWLSETPEKPSMGWDASYNRVVTWGKFKSKVSGKHFLVFNTHFDHRGDEARKNSAILR